MPAAWTFAPAFEGLVRTRNRFTLAAGLGSVDDLFSATAPEGAAVTTLTFVLAELDDDVEDDVDITGLRILRLVAEEEN